MWPRLSSCTIILGSLSNNEGNSNEDGKKAIGLDWQNNNIAREHSFLYIFLPSLHDYHVKVPNFTFYVFRYEAQHGFSKVKVDSVNAQMKRVFEIIKKKRGLKRTGSHFMM